MEKTKSLPTSGYLPCACPDCFEIAVGLPGAFCHACADAGCSDCGDCARDAFTCPGCGCEPGDGVTESCNDPTGCGHSKAVRDGR